MEPPPTLTPGDVVINGTTTVKDEETGEETTTHTGTINGLHNTTWKPDDITTGQAATEDQLAAGLATKADIEDVDALRSDMSMGFARLGSEVNEVAAGSAALAALDYMPYDPDDKLSFAVGTGTYKSNTALALGMKYWPNRNVAINAGTTIGYNDNMWNVGVSFRFGKGGKRDEARLSPEQEQALIATVQQLAVRVQQLEAQQKEKAENAPAEAV